MIKEKSTNTQNQINKELFNRNIPSENIQLMCDFRPKTSKYTYMPIIENCNKKNEKENAHIYKTFHLENIFFPGNRTPPYSGFAQNINTETQLRNQIYAIQNCEKTYYIPSTKSDLYTLNNYKYSTFNEQKYKEFMNDKDYYFKSDLFNNYYFSNFSPNPNSNKIGYCLFNNHTRQQIKDI